MATAVRNTGTHFRFDDDDHLWHAKVRVQVLDSDGEQFLEYLNKVATLLELLAWLADIFSGLANTPGYTVKGTAGGDYTIVYTPPS